MSRTVHLLKFWKENPEFLDKVADKNECVSMLKECGENDLAYNFNDSIKDSYHAILYYGKKFDRHFQKLIDKFNADNNVISKRDLYKGLTLPRLKVLMALDAQKKGLRITPAYSADLILSDTPERFQNKFGDLLVIGFWFLGSVIEDSLSDDPDVNCGNPFGFIPGDLGHWWAGIVMLDWTKYITTKQQDKSCLQFYNDPNLKRSLRYHQDSALSHLNRVPVQFLDGTDLVNFNATIETVKSNAHNLILCSKTLILEMEQFRKMYKGLLLDK